MIGLFGLLRSAPNIRSLVCAEYGVQLQLEYAYEELHWRTVISHMSFTNHFNYVIKNDGEKTGLYMRTFREILRSLLPPGRFIYAPKKQIAIDAAPAALPGMWKGILLVGWECI